MLRLQTEKQIWTALNIIKERGLNVQQTEAYIDSVSCKQVKPRKKVVTIFKDVRIFVNTVNKAINTMKEAGIAAESNKTETDDYIEFLVRIPKSSQQQKKAAAKTETA